MAEKILRIYNVNSERIKRLCVLGRSSYFVAMKILLLLIVIYCLVCESEGYSRFQRSGQLGYYEKHSVDEDKQKFFNRNQEWDDEINIVGIG